MKKFPWSPVIVGLLIVAFGGLATYGYLHRPATATDDASSTLWQTETSSTSSTNSPLVLTGSSANAKQYTSAAFHFSLSYPSNLVANEYQEADGNLTVTFQAQDGSNEGFQIFVTPYSSSTITPARFKLDEPSGVSDDQTAIVIDGVPATMFYSTNAVMGDTREVWFINHGFLYEVTTYKTLDSWLAQIMQTWQFN